MTPHAIEHLAGIRSTRVGSSRIESHVLASGPSSGEPVLFLHGNLASSTFWEQSMLALPARFQATAIDQRGYGLTDPTALIDSTRGVTDWVDDVIALADALGWDRFHLVGHSLGGCVAWGLLALHAERLASVTLVAPGPPCGFGGARDAAGTPNHEDGAGSGAGLVHAALVERLRQSEREVSDPFFSPRAAMNRLYWKPPLRPGREEDLLTGMLQVHLGVRQFPGDWKVSPHWPGVAPGTWGPINAIAPLYNQWVLPRLFEVAPGPPLLWVHGADDAIISNQSLSDPAVQGQMGLRPDWPGEQVFPPQPFLRQIECALDGYQQRGGVVRRHRLQGVGHSPQIERPVEFATVLNTHLLGAVPDLS